MGSKGITRGGDAYCLECGEAIDRQASKCESCSAELSEEVVAFACPRCHRVIGLGTGQCPNCGLKFKMKAVKPREGAEDDRLLMKLIEWGGKPGEEANAEEEQQVDEEVAPVRGQPPSAARQKYEKLAKLKDSIEDLMANRAHMLKNMEERLEQEKSRLAEISSMADSPESSQRAEVEILALADEMADVTMLQAHMESLADEISELMNSVDAELSDEAKERGLAARALKSKLQQKETELAELKAREEQLAAREEMVDRKIKAYAAKKKQLDGQEADLGNRLKKLEEEKARLEELRTAASGAQGATEQVSADAEWRDERKRLREKVLGLRFMIGTGDTVSEVESVEADLDREMSAIEEELKKVVSDRSELEKKLEEASAVDHDMRKLLKVLDQLLGQLPADIVERFAKSEDFTLYEKMLDRFNV